MAIWFRDFSTAYARERGVGTMIDHLGIEILEAGDDYLRGRMPVDERTRQPAGVLHGGASVAFAETLASWAASYCVDPSQHHCVGIEINANHVRPVSDGYVLGTARSLNLGRTLQVWEVRIENEQGKLVCISRVTMAVLKKASEY
jgi:1,4-dihydroxy-2-naphthoyl-CoA hydrolase